jgi:hypothetical protein
MLLQTSAPILALNINWASGDTSDTEMLTDSLTLSTDTVSVTDTPKDGSLLSELTDDETGKADLDNVNIDNGLKESSLLPGNETDFFMDNSFAQEQERIITPTKNISQPSPSFFVPNVGQYGTNIDFETQRFMSGDVVFSIDGLTVALPTPKQQITAMVDWNQSARSTFLTPDIRDNLQKDQDTSSLSLQFLNTNPSVEITGTEKSTGYVNYYLGNDPAQWRTNVTTYEGIVYKDIYPGIDL